MPKRRSFHSESKFIPTCAIDSEELFANWNSFSGVEALSRESFYRIQRSERMRKSRETPDFTAKMGHCPEVDANRFLIHRVIFPAVPRLNSI